MPSFDIVSEVDIQEVRNGVENATREVESRFDFRGVEASFELNDANKTIKVLSESDFQVNQLLDILRAKLLKRGIEGTSLDVPEEFVHSGKTWFVEAKLKQGIESAVQKKIVKLIKDSKLKVQAQIRAKKFVLPENPVMICSPSWRWCAAAIWDNRSSLKTSAIKTKKPGLTGLFFRLSAPVQLQSGLSPYCLF